jgi:hypothetical protein
LKRTPLKFRTFHEDIESRGGIGIKAVSLVIIIILIAGSTVAFAEVNEKSSIEEVAPANGGFFFANEESWIDMGATPAVSSSNSPIAPWRSNNRLRILAPACSDRCSDPSPTMGGWATLELAPDTSGYTMLFHRLPSGDLQIRYMGYLQSGHRYRLSLCADSIGSHELWYRVGWQESNRVKLDVFGLRP